MVGDNLHSLLLSHKYADSVVLLVPEIYKQVRTTYFKAKRNIKANSIVAKRKGGHQKQRHTRRRKHLLEELHVSDALLSPSLVASALVQHGLAVDEKLGTPGNQIHMNYKIEQKIDI